MQKIPSLFLREDAERGKQSLVVDKVTPGCEWVLRGEGVASRKWDGTAVMVKDGRAFKRYDAKHGKPAPKDGIPCQEPDPITGHWPHWVPCDEKNPADKWIIEAWRFTSSAWGERCPDGTYEAVGPCINSNPDNFDRHELRRHGDIAVNFLPFNNEPVTFEFLKTLLGLHHFEGLVFRHPDGRMCKIKRKDFGLLWPVI